MDIEGLLMNKAVRVPVVLLIDNSATMDIVVEGQYEETDDIQYLDGKNMRMVHGGVSLSDKVVSGVNLFYEIIDNHYEARNSCEIAIVSFSDDAELVEGFSTIDEKKEFKRFEKRGNNTNISKGINEALRVLEERKMMYRREGVDYYQPWLVLFTDGNPTDKIKAVQKRVKDLEKEDKLTVYVISLDKNVNMEVLKGFSNKNKPIELDVNNFQNFFEWLGKSVATVSADRDYSDFLNYEKDEIVEVDDIDVSTKDEEEPKEMVTINEWDI